MVLWVVVVCGMMMLGVMKACRAKRALAHEEFGAVEAHWLARAGVEQAMAVLEDDDPSADSPADKWYDNPGIFEKVELGSGTFSVRSAADNHRAGLDDEAARVNLTVADKKQLTELKTLSETQVDSLIDWRRGGDQPSPNGANAGYYQHLSLPYEMRGKDFQTHRELLLVRGFEDRSFFGRPGAALAAGGDAAQTTVYSYQPNRDPTGAPRINFNTVSAELLQQRFNFTPQLAAGVMQTRGRQQ
jgi:type II secretory pathway component PulK